ncbi:hypothetical protein CDL15_Pgr023662 [Punica granatum]|uniref:Uncharacterized protein n=1 Tax=Punica granatum TaxID=22663 RepID=A0A218WC11_PUNGR|nr:hypothetical protein CDL15_Pgr023662 [Punica granatum]
MNSTATQSKPSMIPWLRSNAACEHQRWVRPALANPSEGSEPSIWRTQTDGQRRQESRACGRILVQSLLLPSLSSCISSEFMADNLNSNHKREIA